jgi:hypothetical protein
MKQTLSVIFALALSSALLAGCDRPAGDAGSGATGASGSGTASGSAGSTSDPAKKKTSPSPAGSSGTAPKQ